MCSIIDGVNLLSCFVYKRTLPLSDVTLMDCFNLFTLEESLTGDDRPVISKLVLLTLTENVKTFK